MKNGFFAIILFLLSDFCILGNEPSSVMASGDWYKIAVDRDGIYRITYSELVGLGITDPANVRIYGSGGVMMLEKPDRNLETDLQEIPIWIHTGSDGVFKNGDYILFYGRGPAVWQYNREKKTFEQTIHLWDNHSYYFITSKEGGKRITTETPPTATYTQTVTSFDERQFYEKEQMNLSNSGRYWYSEDFDDRKPTYHYSFTVPDIEAGSPTWMTVSFIAQTTDSKVQLKVECNDRQIANRNLPELTADVLAMAITFNTDTFNISSGNRDLSVKLTMNLNGLAYARGFLDYIRLYTRRRLNMSSSQLFFRDTQSVGEGVTTRFQISGSSSNTHVWDISDMQNIRRMETSQSGGVLSFSATTGTLREFVAFDVASGNLLKPVFPEKNKRTDNQNLHGIENVDMVIVTHPDFLDASRELAALHRDREGMSVEVVTAGQVYNEFSSGMQDPAAIRNFMKHLYEKPSTVKLKYLLLIGSGSYDNKSNRETVSTCRIVTYQSANSWHKTNSFVSDDYFGIVGDNEAIETGKLAIGVGRIPVRTAEQAKEAVAKIRRYMDSLQSGDWPNQIVLLADDGDSNEHIRQTEDLAKNVSAQHPQYTVEKLYLDAFPRVATADGHRYPEIEQQLTNLMNSGCLLVNFMGHGNVSGLTSERVVNTTSIAQWKNKIYPLFIAATCEFGRYDNNGTNATAAENMMLSPHGGSIGVISSTRLVLSGLNSEFNQNFFRELFTRTQPGDEHRLGDVLRRAKNATRSDENNINKLCFTLLGDPALKLPIPQDSVQTLSINEKPVSEPLDTLKANRRITVKGCISDVDGHPATGFNGVLHFSLFDKEHERQTYNHSGNATPLTFYTQTSTLFKGKTSVRNGEFELTFFMPRNINYRYGFGKIAYYARSDDGRVAAGSFRKIVVGGSVPMGTDDTEGPEIRLFMNDTLFRDGGITDENPRLIAFLRDETGINTSDEGLGQNITVQLSHDPFTVYTLNRYYEADLDSHNKGSVNYRFANLPAGDYELWFEAWDLQNHASQASIKFRVTHSSALHIDKLYNYPNPFADHTRIYFEFNMPDTELQVELQIYDFSGRLLRSMKQSLISEGYTSGEFEWDGHDANGNRMNAGVYPYRVLLHSANGQMVWQTSKMIIVF